MIIKTKCIPDLYKKKKNEATQTSWSFFLVKKEKAYVQSSININLYIIIIFFEISFWYASTHFYFYCFASGFISTPLAVWGEDSFFSSSSSLASCCKAIEPVKFGVWVSSSLWSRLIVPFSVSLSPLRGSFFLWLVIGTNPSSSNCSGLYLPPVSSSYCSSDSRSFFLIRFLLIKQITIINATIIRTIATAARAIHKGWRSYPKSAWKLKKEKES